MKEVVIGLDIGTTNVKAIAFDLSGNVIAEAEEMIDTFNPKPGYAEQKPEQIEGHTKVVLREIFDRVRDFEVLGVGLSSAMHSLICVDEGGAALSDMLIWSDGRSSDLIEQLDEGLKTRIYMKTGTPIHPMSPLFKLLWMKSEDFEPYREATYFMSMKEYLLYKWTGKRVVDYAMASATGMLNVHTLNWDDEALLLAGIEESQLSTIVAPTKIVQDLRPEMKQELGWPDDVPLVIGSADGQLANLGNGAIAPGEVAISVGTSGAIRQFVEGLRINKNGETFSYLFTEDSSIIGGPTNNGGIVLQWLKDLMEFDGSYEAFLIGAEDVPVGAEGLIFVPYINGERAPVWNQKARGNFYGLNVVHRRNHFVRAVLEGIVFNLYQISRSVEAVAGKPSTISVNGGMAKSMLWVQILADVFGSEIQLADTHHASAWGAAWTALVSIGRAETFEQIKENIPIDRVVKPDMENHLMYQQIFKKYSQIAKGIEKYF